MPSPQPRPNVAAIPQYVAGKPPVPRDGITVYKLSSNENPLGTSAQAVSAFSRHAGDLARYPDAGAIALREAIAAHHDLDPARVIYGTGSDEVLHLIAGAYAGPGDDIRVDVILLAPGTRPRHIENAWIG